MILMKKCYPNTTKSKLIYKYRNKGNIRTRNVPGLREKRYASSVSTGYYVDGVGLRFDKPNSQKVRADA